VRESYPLPQEQAEKLRTMRWVQAATAVLMLMWCIATLVQGEYGADGFRLWFPLANVAIWPAAALQSFRRLRRHETSLAHPHNPTP
jgi:hypothetical protein